MATPAVPWLGMTMTVLRPADGRDCTLGGITSQATVLTLVGVLDLRDETGQEVVGQLPMDCQLAPASEDRPAVALVVDRHELYLMPVRWGPFSRSYARGGRCYMEGGHFAESTDSRTAGLLRDLSGSSLVRMVPVRDRVE